MNDYTFRLGMKRLMEVYGEKNYTGPRAEQLWEIVKNCNEISFSNWIDQVISDSRYAPLGEQFREFARKDRRTFQDKNAFSSLDKTPNCPQCWDRGLVLLSMKPELVKFATDYFYPLSCTAICDCAKGLFLKTLLENEKDSKDIAKHVLKPIHFEWYHITNRWTKPTYAGVSWEERRAVPDFSAHQLAQNLSSLKNLNSEDVRKPYKDD